MKKPRIEAFAPKAYPLKSSFDDMPRIEKPTQNVPTQESAEQKRAVLQPQREVQPDDTTTPLYHDTTIPSNHDTTIPEQESSIEEAIRKAVKQIGKEAATYRFTVTEKQALADIEYSYKRLGMRTSGNEITRIGLNFLIEDFHRNGESSILAKILKLLNA